MATRSRLPVDELKSKVEGVVKSISKGIEAGEIAASSLNVDLVAKQIGVSRQTLYNNNIVSIIHNAKKILNGGKKYSAAELRILQLEEEAKTLRQLYEGVLDDYLNLLEEFPMNERLRLELPK